MSPAVTLGNRNFNNSISLTIFNRDKIRIPVNYYSDRSDLIVKLELRQLDIAVNGSKQQLIDQAGSRSWSLQLQSFSTNGLKTFTRVLTQNDLNTIGTYTGNIIVMEKSKKEKDISQNNVVLDMVPVNITLEPNVLDTITKYQTCDDQQLSFKAMVEDLYTFLKITPRGGARLINGKYYAEYVASDCEEVILTFRLDGATLPVGSVLKIVDPTGQRLASFDNATLSITNVEGKEAITGYDISEDGKGVSYIRIPTQGLISGEYIYFAEYVNHKGSREQTEIRSIVIN